MTKRAAGKLIVDLYRDEAMLKYTQEWVSLVVGRLSSEPETQVICASLSDVGTQACVRTRYVPSLSRPPARSPLPTQHASLPARVLITQITCMQANIQRLLGVAFTNLFSDPTFLQVVLWCVCVCVCARARAPELCVL